MEGFHDTAKFPRARAYMVDFPPTYPRQNFWSRQTLSVLRTVYGTCNRSHDKSADSAISVARLIKRRNNLESQVTRNGVTETELAACS